MEKKGDKVPLLLFLANISSKVDNSEVSADSYSEVKEAKPGSMMAKANMVRDYNEKNSRK